LSNFTAGQVLTALQLNQLVPAGALMPYAGTAAPAGYLLCDGTAVSRTTYADLFAVVSTTYGAGNGTTTFNVPDLRQKFPMGKAASGTGSTLGGTGGSKDAIAVSHPHGFTDPGHNHIQDQHGHGVTDAGHKHGVDGGDTGIRLVISKGGSADKMSSSGTGGTQTPITITLAENNTTTGVSVNNQTPTNQSHGTGASVDTGGASGTDANLPAYQVFNYLIKT